MAKDDPENIRSWLAGLPSDILADWLATFAREDDNISRSLQLRKELDAGQDLAALKKLVSGLIGGTPQFVDRKRAKKLVRATSQIRSAIEFAMQRGDISSAARACEYGLARLIKLYARSDDSAGLFNAALRKLANFHLAVIEREGVKGAELARRLAPLMADDDWDFFPLEHWQERLGNDGLDMLESRWRAQFSKKPQSPYSGHGLRNRIADLMRAREDTVGLIDWLAESARASWHWTEVIELCEAHGRRRQAIEIAERASRQHEDDPRLREVLARLYADEGFDEDAMELLWQNFQRRPGVETFVALRQAGGGEWQRWRERALQYAVDGESGEAQANVSLRVSLLLADDDPDSALDAAREGVCWTEVSRDLARALAARRPDEARVILLRLLPDTLEQGCGSSNYDAVGQLLTELRPLMESAAFDTLLHRVRERNRRRPKLLAVLHSLVIAAAPD